MDDLYFKQSDPLPAHLQGMTQEKWQSMTACEREAARDNSHLTPQLIGLEGYRVQVVTMYGEKRRFIVGKSTGWRPCHLEIARYDSSGGYSAARKYQSVKVLEHVR